MRPHDCGMPEGEEVNVYGETRAGGLGMKQF